ncbi:hypothetical protein [uncultured Alteromonas sp.]|uniref:hypothetical protein n=1 Tax=uncultured Alteromonas sp. TaxID=179113 RepID=UPI0030D4F5A3
MSKMKPTPQEQFMILKDMRHLLSQAKTFLLAQRQGVLHTNRYIDTGWVKMEFDFTVQSEGLLTCFFVRPIRQASDLKRLRALLEDVRELVDSGIMRQGIPFSLELIIGLNSDDVTKSDITQITRHFSFVEKTIFFSFDKEKAIH